MPFFRSINWRREESAWKGQVGTGFLRLVRRLGLSIEENKTFTEALNRLIVAEGLKLKTWLDEAETLENAKREALRLDAEGKDLNCFTELGGGP